MKVAIVWATALSLAGCGVVGGARFVNAYAVGDRAFSAGRFHEAADAYGSAAAIAERERDREEARYARADSLFNAGELDAALALFDDLATTPPHGERAVRSAFRAAQIRLARGDHDRAIASFTSILHDAPEHGVAHHALQIVVADVEATKGRPAAIAFEDALYPQVEKTRLGEEILYDASVRRVAIGQAREALDGFLRCATRYPYPDGALFDDALWRASLLHEQLGDVPAAIADLERLLAVREPSYMTGSYNRPRMAPAQLRIGELYRDALGDHTRARSALHRVYSEHTTSILRAQALFEEGSLARDDHDASTACAIGKMLLDELPDSRYARRSDDLCPALADRASALRGARTSRRSEKSVTP